MNPLVSILVPIYGVEERIGRCAVSLFEQTYKNIEYIFVDDSTPDNSIVVLKSVMERYPNRLSSVKIITHEGNRGLATTRNTAVDNATGEFVIHVDSDDYLSINAVEELVSQQCLDDSDIVSCGYLIYHKSHVDKWGTPNFGSPKDLAKSILSRKVPVCVAGRLIRRTLYTDNNVQAIDGINMAEDYAVSPLLAYYAKRVSALHSFLYHYDCTNESSYTYSFSEEKCEQMWRVLDYLNIFFSKKDVEYICALNYARLSILIMQLKLCAVDGHQLHYYGKLLERLSKIDDESSYKSFAPYDRLLLHIKNYMLLKVYVRVMVVLKRILKGWSLVK